MRPSPDNSNPIRKKIMKKWVLAALALVILILYINSYLTHFNSRVRTISVDEYTWSYTIDDGSLMPSLQNRRFPKEAIARNFSPALCF